MIIQVEKTWYNQEHRHSVIRYVTPEQRHRANDTELLGWRQHRYQPRAEHPERWGSRAVRDRTPIGAVHLNPELELHAA